MNRIVQWFVENPIAANLCMVVIFIGGIASLFAIDKEAFPTAATGIIEISAPYPGAGPKEVEEQIIIRIEEAVGDLDGIEEISSMARQGSGTVRIEAVQGYDIQKLLNDVETRVDAIDTFPEDAEQLQVREQQWRTMIMDLAVYGQVDESALKQTAQVLRDELAALPNISIADLAAVRDDEVAIEVSEENLRRYNLSFDQVVSAIRGASINLPAGTIKSTSGDIQLQTRGQAYFEEDFENIVVVSNPDGGKLYLGDIAEIKDGFVETDFVALLNGIPAVYVRLYLTEDPNVLKARDQVYQYLEEIKGTLPAGIGVELWRDNTLMFQDRMNLLMENSLSGLLLVFVVLVLFLRPVLAVWVCVGISIAFMGCLWLLPYLGVSLNMISLFGFLLVLGIVVDDAIIVGESIYSRYEHGLRSTSAAASGTRMVSKPVLFAVISTMVFFAPMLFVPGQMGTMSAPIGIIVILCLAFSLFESLLILPSHLSHLKPERKSRFAPINHLSELRGKISAGLQRVVDGYYQPFLSRALRNSGLTLACFTVAFFLSLAVFVGGWLRVSFAPIIQADQIDAQVTLGEGVPFSETRAVTDRMTAATEQLREDPELLRINGSEDFIDNVQTWAYGNNIRFVLALKSPEERDVPTQLVARKWRQLIGEVPEAEELRINFTINTRSADIRLQLSVRSDRTEDQEAAVAAVKQALARYPGTIDIKDDLQSPRDEIQLSLKKNAEVLGLSLNDIARQIRLGFYGAEVQRIPRAKEDVKVMLRYPEEERRNIDHLNEVRIRTPDGREVPLHAVADIEYVPGYSTIRRLDRKRTIVITADLQPGFNANEIVRDLFDANLANWQQRFPGFTLAVSGDLQDQNEFLDSMAKNFMFSLVIIYGLMAVAFRSYWQPFIVLTAIPFGFMGSVIGHLIMGREVSMLSMLGFVACAGVVVNDNLVLLDRISSLRAQGMEVFQAVMQAGRDRFRAIILTSVTTFIGLTPILFEQSMQAAFLIPMVISLAFGVLFATTVTLVLVPCLFLVGEQITERWNLRKLAALAGSDAD
ncbi:efflux RND transporter permease subunit [Gilvimarinus sp. F26214L]|uniref:efflux RND transporter permease subunit n=1 Tax=Gilvimarinus sp. DZF01 TaxID=3461371 RepID=UPI004045D46D